MKKPEIGDKIKLLEKMKGEYFNNQYNGIEVGEIGTIIKVQKFTQEIILSVKWDNGRELNIILPEDKIEIITIH